MCLALYGTVEKHCLKESVQQFFEEDTIIIPIFLDKLTQFYKNWVNCLSLLFQVN